MQEDKEKVRYFINQSANGRSLADADDIFALGIVNSMFAMQLVQFLEREFNMAVENDDLDIDNFRSVDRIAEFVRRKQASAS